MATLSNVDVWIHSDTPVYQKGLRVIENHFFGWENQLYHLYFYRLHSELNLLILFTYYL